MAPPMFSMEKETVEYLANPPASTKFPAMDGRKSPDPFARQSVAQFVRVVAPVAVVMVFRPVICAITPSECKPMDVLTYAVGRPFPSSV